MVYVFFVIVVTIFLDVGFQGFGVTLQPAAFFGVLLGVGMVIAIATKVPVSKLAEYTGLKPVVGLGFFVYATFPALRISAPANQWILVALFAYSGLRFAGLPAHKAMIVGPAERNAGGRVTGTYYLLRNTVVIRAPPSGAGSMYRVRISRSRWLPSSVSSGSVRPVRRGVRGLRLTALSCSALATKNHLSPDAEAITDAASSNKR